MVMAAVSEEIPKVSKRELKNMVKDEKKTARAAHLVYVNDKGPGIERRRKGDHFDYYFRGKPLTDDEELLRIQQLVLPPAWEKVWICKNRNGHLQATGYDVRNRKQYKYHPHWNSLRNETKFYRLYDFGKALPAIRLQLKKDLRISGLTERKVLAAVVSLMERTSIRVGSTFYEKEYGSFGLTTLKDRHVSFKGSKVTFSFKGKKGISHKVTLQSRKLAAIIKKCRDIPGKELFQFFDNEGKRHSIDSGQVNNYIRQISREDFTAKDFRTWSGTVQAFIALSAFGKVTTDKEIKKKMVEALDVVSGQLGNTRTVCRKYYVHPMILSLYEKGRLPKHKVSSGKVETENEGLTPEEKVVMNILASN